MRITGLKAENFKRLKAVEINPDDHTVVIAGRNAQGKTSVLDAIWAALAGAKGSKELVRPIRDGEIKARVEVTLDDLRIERKWTPSGSSLTVGPVDGTAKFNSPQAILDKLIGSLTFDPLQFAEADPKAQVATLIDLIGRETFDTIAEERKAAYDNRTEMNREVRSTKARLDALGDDVPRKGEPPAVDVQALSEEYGVAREKVALRDRWQRLTDEVLEIEARAASLPESRDVETVNDLLSNANVAADLRHRWEQRQALTRELEQAEEVAAKHTAFIEDLDQKRLDLIENADLPVEGLAFDDDGVTYHGVPFVQSSAAERLKVSVAMAMALNPDLRVICIRDASLLDSDSKAALMAMAEEHDYQIWYEVVGDGGEIGVVIEDGEVA